MNNETGEPNHLSREVPLRLYSRSAAETVQLGRTLGACLLQVDRSGRDGALVVALHGGLGAGKTTLTQGIAAGLGVTAPVTSPTFTLVREYAAPAVHFVHMDSYRLGDLPEAAAMEAESIGVGELLDDPATIMVVEWAERLAGLLPADTVHIELLHAEAPEAESTRQLLLWTESRAFGALLQGLVKNISSYVG